MIPQPLLDALRRAQHVCVLTGSGVSAESGVPTFRDAQSGLWEKFDPLQLATPEAFLRDPELVWRWYRWRRQLVSAVQPNAAHTAVASLASLVPALTLVTQNVDGLHQRAGSRDVIEFHGNLFVDRCFTDGCVTVDRDTGEGAPACRACGGLLRPGVVWFGEAIPSAALDAAAQAVADCDVFLSVGTSSTVWPAAGFAETAIASGATVAEINPEATPLSDRAHHCLAGKAGSVLPELIHCLAL